LLVVSITWRSPVYIIIAVVRPVRPIHVVAIDWSIGPIRVVTVDWSTCPVHVVAVVWPVGPVHIVAMDWPICPVHVIGVMRPIRPVHIVDVVRPIGPIHIVVVDIIKFVEAATVVLIVVSISPVPSVGSRQLLISVIRSGSLLDQELVLQSARAASESLVSSRRTILFQSVSCSFGCTSNIPRCLCGKQTIRPKKEAHDR